MKTTIITLVIQQEKEDPELVDKIADRVYRLDCVKDVEAKLIAEVENESRQPA
jgi:uncharacterized protein YlbG (UPF0298 family)